MLALRRRAATVLLAAVAVLALAGPAHAQRPLPPDSYSPPPASPVQVGSHGSSLWMFDSQSMHVRSELEDLKGQHASGPVAPDLGLGPYGSVGEHGGPGGSHASQST